MLVATRPASFAGSEGSQIFWGSPITISGETDVSTAGSLVAAFNMFGPDVVVNGVIFSAFNVTTGTTSANNGNYTSEHLSMAPYSAHLARYVELCYLSLKNERAALLGKLKVAKS